MNYFLFGWLIGLIFMFLGEIKGRQEGYKEAHDNFCHSQAWFIKYFFCDEYLKFHKDNNIPITKSMQRTFDADVNVYDKHRFLNEYRDMCIKVCEREKAKEHK